MDERQFRTDESYVAERITRDMVSGFLEAKGFTSVSDIRKGQAQTIQARTPDGRNISARVRLCWNRSGKKNRSSYSAFQLIARIDGSDWVGSISKKVARDKEAGVTHILAVQREEAQIVLAALLPIDEVLAVWQAQRDRGVLEISSGRLKSNPVMNGSSPTLYLELERAPSIAKALWDHVGVADVAAIQGPTVVSNAGAGYGDMEQNKLAEVAAVGLVRADYENRAWTVRSREQDGCGYDLHCTHDTVEEHVEVKGVRGVSRSFNLTAGEVRCASEDPLFVLVLVNSVLTTSPIVTRYSGPEMHRAFTLSPTQFRAVAKT